MKNLIFALIFSTLLTSCGEFGKEPEKGIGLRIYQSSKFPEINYDGVSDRYYSQEMNNVYTKEPYMYIYITNRLFKNDYMDPGHIPNHYGTLPLVSNVNFTFSFSVNNSCTENRLYYIKKEDVYLLRNDGEKIPAQMQASGQNLDSIGSECSIDRVSYLSGKTLLKYKMIAFQFPLYELLNKNTKLVIAKVYKNDKVIMQNIEYSFDIHKFDHVNPYWNRKVNIKLPQ